MLVTAGRAVQELLLFVDDEEALFADCVAAVEIPRVFLLTIIEVIAHRALHACNIIKSDWYIRIKEAGCSFPSLSRLGLTPASSLEERTITKTDIKGQGNSRLINSAIYNIKPESPWRGGRKGGTRSKAEGAIG